MNEMNNGLSLRKAAYNNGINYQTLHNRIVNIRNVMVDPQN
jgi:lambda repressor-like predicted transcriptional regulator